VRDKQAARPRVRLLGFGIVLLLSATACGSTVPQEVFRAAGRSGDGGLSITPGQPAQGPTVPGVTPGTQGPGGLGGGPTEGLPGTGGTGGVPSAFAPGITDTTIYIGSYYQTNQGAANAALGAGGLDQGDARKPQNVVIDEINKAGGLAGRKIVPIYAEFDATSRQSVDQQEQAACAKWTQDNKVFAILLSSPVIDECAKQAGALELGYGAAVPETYRQYPQRIDIDSMEMVRMGHVTVDGLAKQGYFGGRPKIGLLTWDEPNYRQGIDQGYVSALKRHGLSPDIPTAYVRVPQSTPELGQTTADISGVVLRFRSRGIDHVMILDGPAGACGGGCLTLEFAQQANSQRYTPRYGFNDMNFAKDLEEQGLLPPSQASGSISVGWTSLNASYDEGFRKNAQREKCYALMREHGIDMGNPNSQAAALEACTTLWFLQLLVSRVRGALTVNGMLSAVNGLGYSYTSPNSYYNYFSATRHDGAAGVRIMYFVDSCTCYRFVPGAYKV
jgi:hypothetical protein